MSGGMLRRIGSWAVLGLGSSLLAAACGESFGPVACGDGLLCEEGSVCIIDYAEPDCYGLAEGESCGAGTTESNCGGVGEPCCCAPTPPSDYHCLSADICDGDEPSCDCLDPCTGLDECVPMSTAYTFICDLYEE